MDGQDGEAYNISNDDDGLTLGEYAEYIASLANLKVRYEIENNESVSKATFALLDTHKIKNIGWKPQYSVKDGLKRTYMIKKEQLTNKWFEFGKDEDGNELPKTVISREFSSEWKTGDEPYYPVNDEKNGALYAEYKKLAGAEEKVIFGGRLGEYKYYDMDAVIASALDMCEKELQ